MLEAAVAAILLPIPGLQHCHLHAQTANCSSLRRTDRRSHTWPVRLPLPSVLLPNPSSDQELCEHRTLGPPDTFHPFVACLSQHIKGLARRISVKDYLGILWNRIGIVRVYVREYDRIPYGVRHGTGSISYT